MKVYANYRYGPLSGGMILVAANSAEEAHEAFHKAERYEYMWTKCPDGYVGDNFYDKADWQLLPMLEAHVDWPQVLAEAGYTD